MARFSFVARATALVFAATLATGFAIAQDIKFFRIGTGGTAGTYYPIGGLIGNAISTTTIAARLRLAPKWLAVLGLGTGVVLLFTVGLVPWIEVLFPAWVFIFSLHILVASFRTAPLKQLDS